MQFMKMSAQKKAKEALTANDLEEFGKLLNASHASLRDDYEVTGLELDTLVSQRAKTRGGTWGTYDWGWIWWMRHRISKRK